MFQLGMIGLGAWGKNLINSVQGKSETVRFVAAATRSPAKVSEFAGGQGIKLGDDERAVLDDGSIDGIVVSSPALAHVAQITAALEAGKHVLAVKPLALTRADAEALYGLARAKGVFLGLGYERCFLPAAEELRRRVREGELGQIVHVEGAYCVPRYLSMTRDDWKTDNKAAPPGALSDHILYMMIELLGPVEELLSRGGHLATDLDVCDTSTVMLRFPGGVSGLLTAIGVTPAFARLQFFGTAGWAEIRGATRFEMTPLKGEPTVIDFPAFDTLRCQLESFAAAAQGRETFRVSPETAIAGVAAVQAMGTSAASGGWVRP